ncbi:MAG: DivIVA protein, partial [Solirubrobacterales bacterium]|nr:DivIVA protein [Solirubrobacterales bacterium]
YGAASGRSSDDAAAGPAAVPSQAAFESALDSALAAPAAVPAHAPPPVKAAPEPAGGTPPENGGDLDGARLVALNMALNGESRSDTERYLAENYQLPDRVKLVDEVYAAIEG